MVLREIYLRETQRRELPDRRKRPTPILSRFTFWGRRKMLRRKEDQRRGGYVDRYSPSLLFFLLLIVGLNLLDALFTMMILDYGGWEVNPIVRAAIGVYGDRFWVWKFLIVSVNVILLCLHVKFKYVRKIILGICLVYLAIVIYQIRLLAFH